MSLDMLKGFPDAHAQLFKDVHPFYMFPTGNNSVSYSNSSVLLNLPPFRLVIQSYLEKNSLIHFCAFTVTIRSHINSKLVEFVSLVYF